MKITEQEIIDAPDSAMLPTAKWLGCVYGDTDDWRIFAVPVGHPEQRFIEVPTNQPTVCCKTFTETFKFHSPTCGREPVAADPTTEVQK